MKLETVPLGLENVSFSVPANAVVVAAHRRRVFAPQAMRPGALLAAAVFVACSSGVRGATYSGQCLQEGDRGLCDLEGGVDP